MLTAAAFIGSGRPNRILTGSHEGELRRCAEAALTATCSEVIDGGNMPSPVRSLRTSPPSCAKPGLMRVCSSTEVQLWGVNNMEHGSLHAFEGSCGGAFDPSATKIMVVGEDLVGTARLVELSRAPSSSRSTPAAHISANA